MPRLTRRYLIHSGGAALATTTAAPKPHGAWGAQPGVATPVDAPGLDRGTVATVPEPTMFVVGPEGIAVAFENEGFGRFDRIGDE